MTAARHDDDEKMVLWVLEQGLHGGLIKEATLPSDASRAVMPSGVVFGTTAQLSRQAVATARLLFGDLTDSGAVRRAYRSLAVRVHPDKNARVGADDAFRVIQIAYDAALQSSAIPDRTAPPCPCSSSQTQPPPPPRPQGNAPPMSAHMFANEAAAPPPPPPVFSYTMRDASGRGTGADGPQTTVPFEFPASAAPRPPPPPPSASALFGFPPAQAPMPLRKTSQMPPDASSSFVAANRPRRLPDFDTSSASSSCSSLTSSWSTDPAETLQSRQHTHTHTRASASTPPPPPPPPTLWATVQPAEQPPLHPTASFLHSTFLTPPGLTSSPSAVPPRTSAATIPPTRVILQRSGLGGYASMTEGEEKTSPSAQTGSSVTGTQRCACGLALKGRCFLCE